MKKFLILTIGAIFIIPLGDVILAVLSIIKKANILPGVNVWYPQFLALLIVFLLGVALVLWGFNKWISVFIALCIISAVFVTRQYTKSMIHLFCINFACLASYIISKFDKKQRRIILRVIIALFIFQVLWVTMQFFNLDRLYNKIGNPAIDDPVGLAGSPNQIGVFFAVISPVVLSVCPYLIPLAIFGIWCSKTATAWGAFVIASLFFTWRKSKKIFSIAVLVLFVCTGAYFLKIDNVSPLVLEQRFSAVKLAFNSINSGKITLHRGNVEKVMTCNPLLGFGLGVTEDLIPFYKGSPNTEHAVYNHFHNDYAELLFTLGWTGFIVLIGWLVNLIWRFYKLKDKKEASIYALCILSYMICSTMLFPTYIAISAMFFILFYGMLEGAIRDGQITVGC